MSTTPLLVKLDTTPLGNDNAIRGVGMYTRLLHQELSQLPDVQLISLGESQTPDVIHYPFFDLFFATLPWRHSAPTVITIHDVIPLKFPEFYPVGKKGRVRYWRQRFLAQRADAIITDSEASKADIVKHLGIKSTKVHVVYLAANPELKKADKNEVSRVKKAYHLPAQYILYVGDINYNKNLPQLIKAVKYLPEDIHLVCVGKNFYPHEIPEWRWIEAQIAMSEVTDRVHLIPDIAGDATKDLAALYSGAVAYVQPSLYEGFGLPILEAMQCRVPVVSTHTSSLIEVGNEYVVFTTPTAESLAEGVEAVLNWSETKRQQVIRAAFEWSQSFTWQKTAQETLGIYRQVLNKK
ncbi:MAG TPA: glycosyltransferase family 1 protein [Vitreimonas sp.]|nr:glycosyltransferase family 1 protein [Vitreimonas sp.]